MDLDRGTLARLDRRLLAGLDRDERFQMVRVPVTPATWSTWKRYCDTAGLSMGRAIAALIDDELASLDGGFRDGAMLISEQAQQRLEDREEALTKRERRLDEADERLSRWSEQLRTLKSEIGSREQRLEAATKLSTQTALASTKPGRNEPCPCGTGRKFRRCHGAPGQQAVGVPQ